MTDQQKVVIVRRQGRSLSADDGLAALLAAYHLQTESEKGQAIADAARLPHHYRAEVLSPRDGFRR